MTANRMKSGTMSTRQSLLFLRPKLLSALYQSAIDFLSETLLWFGARGAAGMKICPNCQQQFPDSFQYCPNDTEHLITDEEFVRRTRRTEQTEPLRPFPSSPAGPVAQTSNFGFSIPEQPSLIARLFAGLRSAGDNFKGAPPARHVAAGDFQFLLKEESLLSRIARESACAVLLISRSTSIEQIGVWVI